MSEAIDLHEADPDWPSAFIRERDLIAPLFSVSPLQIEHMGSTAVPGLPAKPIIDIIVLTDDLASARRNIPALEATGYRFWADNPDQTKLYLAKGMPPAPARTHHLHIHDDADEVQRHLIFRDHLRADPAARADYLALKRDLAARFRDDREAYSRHKTAFIDALAATLGAAPRRTAWKP